VAREISVTLPRRVRGIRGAYYWQPTPAVKKLGFVAEPLGKDRWRAFARAEELNQQVEVERRNDSESSIRRGSVAELIRLYRKDPAFQQLAAKTRQGYGYILDRIEKIEGDVSVTDLTRRHLKDIYRTAVDGRGLAMANAIMRIWRIILGLAVDEGWIETNPASALRLTTPRPRRRLWSDEERERFHKQANEMGRPSMALAVTLGWDLAQRQGDLLRLTWTDWNGSSFGIRQGKTGAVVRVPAMPETCALIEATPRASTRIIVSEATGNPYREDHFRHEFARIRDAAALPADLQFRDLRRTALTNAGDMGATDDELRALSGHQSREVVKTYVVPSDAQARAAQRKRLQRRQNNLAPEV